MAKLIVNKFWQNPFNDGFNSQEKMILQNEYAYIWGDIIRKWVVELSNCSSKT